MAAVWLCHRRRAAPGLLLSPWLQWQWEWVVCTGDYQLQREARNPQPGSAPSLLGTSLLACSCLLENLSQPEFQLQAGLGNYFFAQLSQQL